MHKKYVGITIGPIFDTILDASSPAALWFASYMFSDITKRLCEAITKSELDDVEILTPSYNENISLIDGVGKFHDRIIFSTSNYSKEVMDVIITTVKEETAKVFPLDKIKLAEEDVKGFLREYLQIHYVVKENIEEANCILALSPYLDALELMKTFPKDDAVNPIRKLFAGAEAGKNVWIKESPLYKQVEKHQLKSDKEDGSLKEIKEIAAVGTTEALKRKDYYAVVYADGDNMGSILGNLDSDEAITEFSAACLTYAEESAKQIAEFGGITIYAGGDDLLFLAPVMNGEKSILDLCDDIQADFKKVINEKYKDANASVSFGISVQHAKYPLYEALNNSRKLLALAKKDGDFNKENPKKNNTAIQLQKHSGQSLALCVSNNSYAKVNDLLKLKTDAQQVHSIVYTLDSFSSLVGVLDKNAQKNPQDYERYENAWDNLFDNPEQQEALEYINKVCEHYFRNFVVDEDQGVIAIGDKTSLRTLLYILRFKQFLVEKEGEK